MGKKSFPLRTGKPKALGQDQGNVRQILLLGFDSLAVIFRISILRFFFFSSFVSVNTFLPSIQTALFFVVCHLCVVP